MIASTSLPKTRAFQMFWIIVLTILIQQGHADRGDDNCNLTHLEDAWFRKVGTLLGKPTHYSMWDLSHVNRGYSGSNLHTTQSLNVSSLWAEQNLSLFRVYILY